MAEFKRILLTGLHGQVGSALNNALAGHGGLVALDRHRLDLTLPDKIRQLVREIQPDLIINPAAYTAVDQAEAEVALAHAVNAEAPRVLAEEAGRLGALLVHYSTDYVFDGSSARAYCEDDTTQPLGVYGQTKREGELAIIQSGARHLILRTSWVYGVTGRNFLNTILRLASERDSLSIVADQHGAPTWNEDIAAATIRILKQFDPQKQGIYHLSNSGETTWHGFAMAILRTYERLRLHYGWPALKAHPERIKAISTQDYPTAAQRPLNSRLNNRRLANDYGVVLQDWQSALQQAMSDPQWVPYPLQLART